jgi:transcription-repair coupling factor (superfamily II helicase)
MALSPAEHFKRGRPVVLAGVAEGAAAVVVADIARALSAREQAPGPALVVVCRDGARMGELSRALEFFAPDLSLLEFPAWDCLPYDRVSPHGSISALRMHALSALARGKVASSTIVLTTVGAALQRLPPRDHVSGRGLAAAPGNVLDMGFVAQWLDLNGFARASTVRDAGEYAVRGGILDLFAPGMELGVRLDFFGDTLESIRSFDPQSQRTVGQLRGFDLTPVGEVQLSDEAIRRFRQAYIAEFGAAGPDDLLYEAISEGRRHPGLEHWLPLFYERLDTLFDYLSGAAVVLDSLAEDAAKERLDQITDYYQARRDALEAGNAGVPYKPLPPQRLYLTQADWNARLSGSRLGRLTPFSVPETDAGTVIEIGARQGRSFAAERGSGEGNVFDAVARHVEALQAAEKRVVIALWSEGSRDRMRHLLADHGLPNLAVVATWPEALRRPKLEVALAVLGLEAGFEMPGLALIGEQDILGDRLVRPRRGGRRAQDFISEVTGLSAGDLVVHLDHGIGRFAGLATIEAAGAPHDCLEIHYAGGDKLFLPVENIELLSRYGSEQATVDLDRLGGTGWQARKSRLKQRIREIASELLKVAAARQLREAPRFTVAHGLYDEFCAGFPYEETEDQQTAIDQVLDDLNSGKPMDRLICGDVGFGKTEVALRAAFVTALNGKQVAVVVPTTLLARQHTKTFTERFQGFPVNIAQLSRLVGSADLARAKKDLAEGKVDIAIGTHALLGKTIKFKDLGLVIIDEEQHFGVAHKEKLKQLRAEVHVLTLTATPIPRTLQLALTGVRELSMIASPPIDRLAVRTFVAPFDPVVVREALLRERYRGGQSFYVCPHIEDLGDAKEFLDKHVPEVRTAVAHGQMSSRLLDDVMSAFYEGKYDVLLSTAIIESGLDIPTTNTLIVHRADMFGLAQVYQLRGRVGRSKIRAYALLTLPPTKKITPQAERRLKVIQALDTLGAGFQLASHDLDIRGAGNLLGEEQSGHIKEVGFELYQQMLEEAVLSLKAGVLAPAAERWSPQITMGTPVLIPEDYVPDLSVRLALYRRLADIDDEHEIDAVAAEFADRFGPVPEEVRQLFKVVAIKALCRRANVEKIEAGPKGAVIAFRDNAFPNPDALIRFIHEQGPAARVRPDMKVVFFEEWSRPDGRLNGTTAILRSLAAIARPAKAA